MQFKQFLNNFKTYNLNLYLPLTIVFSSLKINGYVIAFMFLFIYILYKRKEIISPISIKTIDEKLVFSYLIFLIVESIYGAFQINDFRIIIYWIPLFILTLYLYFRNSYDLKNNLYYKNNYYKLILLASIIYFIFYLIMNIISLFVYKNPYQIQDLFWMGSSGAFNISSIFFISLYKLWSEEKFILKSKFIFAIPFYLVVQSTNQSRLGFLYFLCFVFFVLIKNLKKRNFINFFIFLLITISTFSLSNNVIGYLTHIIPSYEGSFIQKNIVGEAAELSKYDGRSYEFKIGMNHFNKSSINKKIFGTGWYSSRVTIVPTRNAIIDRINIIPYRERIRRYYNGEAKHFIIKFYKKDVVSLQGIVAIILDTGFIGLLFLGLIIYRNFYLIFKFESDFILKLFLCSILSIHLLCLYIGYPLNSIPYLLFILPGGLIRLSKKENHISYIS